MARIIHLDPPVGQHGPDYQITMFRDGDPARPLRRVDWRSITAIQTSKNVNDLAGTCTITLKDKNARRYVREMDAGRVRLRGHWSDSLTTVMKIVVDKVRPSGSADVFAGSEDTVIEARCVGKYYQATSLFLPVWDPQQNLPTALLFGLGDAAKKVGGNRPYDIWNYLVPRFVYGDRKVAGVSGIPNSRHWVDHKTRFEKDLGFTIPYLQFDQDDMATALKRLEVLGFTETWVDELGRTVYRRPGWDHPARYHIETGALKDWSPYRGDVGTYTYVEVLPAGNPGIDTAIAQALMSGRAPVPSSYLTDGTSLASSVDKEFVIDTDSKGNVTDKGERNPWRRLQRRLGVRPLPVVSPLIVSQKQAQEQAEGLLRFYARAQKGMTITLPGAPEIRLGFNARVEGELEGDPFDRVGYIEAVAHEYVEGSHYHTSVTLTHGRDAIDPFTGNADPKWRSITLPKFDPADLASGTTGVLGDDEVGEVPTTDGPRATIGSDGRAAAPKDAPRAVKKMIAKANTMINDPYIWGGGHAVAGQKDTGQPGSYNDGADAGSKSGWDCSGATAAVLKAGGKWSATTAAHSSQFGAVGPAGEGEWVTCHYNGGHVFLVIAGLRFDTAHYGETKPAGSGPRWGKGDARPASSYALFKKSHPKDL